MAFSRQRLKTRSNQTTRRGVVLNNFVRVFLLGTRLILASIIGLCLQIVMVVKTPDQLLSVQEQVKIQVVNAFNLIDIGAQYRVAYNLIGGDNILVHTMFVLVAYLLMLTLLLPFNRKKKSGYRYTG